MYKAVPVVVMLALLAGCSNHSDWTRFRGEGGRGHTRNAMTPPLGVRWEFSLQSGQNRGFAFNNLVVLDDTLYFGATDGNFYAMSVDTGYMNWVFRTGAAVNSVPYADDARVYFGSNDGHVYALDRETGNEVWRYDTGRTVQSTVIRHDDQIIFGSDGGGIWFLSLDGELEHAIENPVWHRVTLQVDNGQMSLTPGPADNPRTLGVYNISEEMHEWLLPDEVMQATWYSFPAVTRDHMITQTSRFTGDGLEFNTFALDRDSGEIVWHRRFPSEFPDPSPAAVFSYWRNDLLNILDYQAPAVRRNRVISASGDSVVRAFDERSGDTIWETYFNTHTSSAPMIAGDHVFIGLHGSGDEARFQDIGTAPSGGTGGPISQQTVSQQDDRDSPHRPPRLVALSARSGRKVWELETNGAILSPPVVAGRYMVFGTDRNYVYVLERVF